MMLYKVVIDIEGNIQTVYVGAESLRELEDLIKQQISHDSIIINSEVLTQQLIINKNNNEY